MKPFKLAETSGFALIIGGSALAFMPGLALPGAFFVTSGLLILQLAAMEKTKLLIIETKQALADQLLKINGLNDHIAAFQKEIDCFQNDLAEYEKVFSEDEFKKLASRVGVLEFKSGIARQGPNPLGTKAKSG